MWRTRQGWREATDWCTPTHNRDDHLQHHNNKHVNQKFHEFVCCNRESFLIFYSSAHLIDEKTISCKPSTYCTNVRPIGFHLMSSVNTISSINPKFSALSDPPAAMLEIGEVGNYETFSSPKYLKLFHCAIIMTKLVEFRSVMHHNNMIYSALFNLMDFMM